MDLREYAKTETLALVDRIVGNAEAAAQKARAHAEHEIASIRAQADALQSEVEVHAARAAALEAELEASAARAAGLDADLETQAERAASLEADLDAVIEAHRQVDKERPSRKPPASAKLPAACGRKKNFDTRQSFSNRRAQRSRG